MEGRIRRKFNYTNAVALVKRQKRWKSRCNAADDKKKSGAIKNLGLEEKIAKRQNLEKYK